MLSIIKECKRITESRSLSLLLTISLVLIITSTLAEAMQVKRAGFVGMRGKKDMENSLEDLYASDPDSEAELYAGPEVYPYSYYKRAGFVGMRGKKGGYTPASMRRPTLFDAL